MTAFPRIFDIRRGAMDDGPGIRTTVFFKGCPLSCAWCHNPESMGTEPEIIWDSRACAGCHACRRACPDGASGVSGEATIDRERCTSCGACAEECPSNARRLVGREYPVEELVQILLKDMDFYRATGGGITFSGGEPTLHAEYLSMVLQALKKADIHTALQTCGVFDLDMFRRRLFPYLDIVCFDLKLFDSAAHRKYTGFGNERIMANFSALFREAGERVIPRVPLVPGITATEANLMGIGGFLRELGVTAVELLPFNPGGIAKRPMLGHSVPPEIPESFMSREEEARLREFFMRQLEL